MAEILDGLLFATILLIFALGLYELFISKIEAAENSEFAARLLLIRSLDDLKERLAKLIFLILIVRYFEYSLEQKIDIPASLLYLAVGIALIAVALFLTRGRDDWHRKRAALIENSAPPRGNHRPPTTKTNIRSLQLKLDHLRGEHYRRHATKTRSPVSCGTRQRKRALREHGKEANTRVRSH